MTSLGTDRPAFPKGRSLLRLAVAGAVVAATPVALAGTANAAPLSDWERLAQCESGGNWSINSGNGYYGGLQFSPRTWRAYGGAGMPHQASKSEQIAVAERTLAGQGWGAWPACSRKLGLNGKAEPNSVRASSPPPAPAPPPAPTGGGNYTVVAGDTLSKIAARNGTTWQALFEKNRDTISNANVLRVGQTINV